MLVVWAKDGAQLVLDNLVSEICPLRDTGYRVMKRQSGTDPRLWIEPTDRNHDPRSIANLEARGGSGPPFVAIPARAG